MLVAVDEFHHPGPHPFVVRLMQNFSSETFEKKIVLRHFSFKSAVRMYVLLFMWLPQFLDEQSTSGQEP
jgi:hypothetical protein